MSLLALLILTLLAVAVGGLATWYVAKHYFEISSRDLDRKIQRLERFLRSLAHLIDPEGTRYPYDEEGLPVHPVGCSLEIRWKIEGPSDKES